jgi:hypothetical protein
MNVSTKPPAHIHIVDSSVRHVILHYHLFKNSGSSVDAILEEKFSNQMAYIHGRTPSSTVTNEDLFSFLRANPDVRAVSSHHLRPPKPQSDNFVFFDIIFVRHPLDRLRSMYEFYHRTNQAGDPLGREAHSRDIAGFMELLLREYPHLSNNSQVNFLANGGCYIRPVDKDDLEKATTLLCKAAVPGLTERFDTSISVAKYYLYPAFGPFEVANFRMNVSPGRPAELEVRLEAMREACGPIIYDALLAANQLDLLLVEQAEVEIHRRHSSIPQLSSPSTVSCVRRN